MTEARIPVDLFNPGHVFACMGFVEITKVLLDEVTGVFDWSGPETTFRLAVAGTENPVKLVLQFLEEAEIVSIAPAGSKNTTIKWKIETENHENGNIFPFPDPDSPATLPAILRNGNGTKVVIDHWGDRTRRRDNVKFWAGAGGYPGVALARDALDSIRYKALEHANDPFSLSVEQSSSFRFDWRGSYVPLQIGFSLNNHNKKEMKMLGFPLVEILAAIGLTNARPKRIEKLEYRYGVLGGPDLLDPIFLRSSLGTSTSPIPGLPFRLFRMHLDRPGKDDRCITSVTEETQ